MDRDTTISALAECKATHETICAVFNELRLIPSAELARLEFHDAALYNQSEGRYSHDQATSCLFGEELSLSNPNQHVIGLAQIPSELEHPYSQEVNKEIVFMDLKKLAAHLVDTPKHPMNNMPLDANNIKQFAFRIS